MEQPRADAGPRGAAEGSEQEAFLLCSVCSMPSEPGLRYCSTCRVPLDPAKTVSAEEAAVLVRKRARSRKLRRWRIPAAVAACLVIAAAIVYIRTRPPGPLPQPASDVSAGSAAGAFTQAGYDAAHSNFVPDAPAFSGEVRWSFRTAEPFTGGPSATEEMVYAGTGDRRIIALDAATGELRWEFATGGPVDSTPAIAGDWLFVGLRDGRLLSLDRQSGALRWEYDTGGAVGDSPLVVDGEVYIANGEGRLTVLDAATGKLRWRTGPDRAEGSVTRAGDVVFTTAGTRYYLWDARNGAAIHKYPVGASVSTAVVVSGEEAYVGDFNGSIWVSDITYRPEWYTKGPGRRWLGQLYIWDLGPRPPNGDLWAKRLGRDILYPFALANGTLYIPDGGGNVRAVDIATREVRWTVRAGVGPATGAVLAGDTLLVSTADGLHALDAATGAARWSAVGTGVPSTAAVTSRGTYVTAADGVLYALK